MKMDYHICTTAINKKDKVSNACKLLSMQQSPLVVEATAVRFLLEKGHVMGL